MDINKSIELYNSGVVLNEIDLHETTKLISEKPYLFHPYALLAKFYFQINDDRFQETLTKASLRTQNREQLFNYINSQINNETSVLKNQDAEEKITNESINTIDDFLSNEEIKIEENVVIAEDSQNEVLQIEDNIEDKDLSEFIETKETFENNKETAIEIDSKFDINEFLSDLEEKDENISVNESIDSEELTEQSPEVIVNTNIEFENEVVKSEAKVNEFLNDFEEKNETNSEIEIYDSIELSELSTEINNNFNEENEEEIEFDFTKLKETPTLVSEPIVVDENLQEVETHFSFVENKQTKEPIQSQEISKEVDFFEWLNQIKNKPIEKAESFEVASNQETSKFEEIEEKIEKKTSEIESILDKFINENPQIRRPKKEFFSAENMAKKSEDFDTIMVSETLAKIYEQQGNFSLAIKTYQKLILQFPEKTAFFAAQIENLKK